MFDKVTITYRGAKYEVGRGRDFYGIWITGAPRSQPLEWWPETTEGWSAAWTRFASIEAPGTIVPVGRRTPAVGQAAGQADEDAGGALPYGQAPAGQAAAGQAAAGWAQAGRAAAARGRTRTMTAVALLGAGVALGTAGLFPGYLGGSSLASQAFQLIPHVIYLAAWTAGAALILLGGARARIGTLLAAGLTVVTFGLFAADGGTAIALAGSAGGWGLGLSLLGWLACAAGSAAALPVLVAARPGPGGPGGPLARPRGPDLGPAIMLVLAGLGTAIAFAPAWDSFTLRTAAGQSQVLILGNAFHNPGLVIAGDVAVMVALAAAVVAAAFWRPVRHGAALLAGAVIPMAAQAISALVQASSAPSPAQFGFSPAQATQLGLTISAGLTATFWIYCGLLVVLAVSCAWMLFTPQRAPGPAPAPAVPGWNPAPQDDLAGEDADGGGTDGGDDTGVGKDTGGGSETGGSGHAVTPEPAR